MFAWHGAFFANSAQRGHASAQLSLARESSASNEPSLRRRPYPGPARSPPVVRFSKERGLGVCHELARQRGRTGGRSLRGDVDFDYVLHSLIVAKRPTTPGWWHRPTTIGAVAIVALSATAPPHPRARWPHRRRNGPSPGRIQLQTGPICCNAMRHRAPLPRHRLRSFRHQPARSWERSIFATAPTSRRTRP